MRIAIVKLSALGDIVHAMVVLQFIKQFNKDIVIDWVVEKNYQELLDRPLDQPLPDGYRWGSSNSYDNVYDIEPEVFYDLVRNDIEDSDLDSMPEFVTLEMARDWAGDYVLRGIGKDKAAALDSLESYIEMEVFADITSSERALETLKKYEGYDFNFKNIGAMYEVNLAPANEDYLQMRWLFGFSKLF